MDLKKIKQLRRTLTLHFAILAVLTAMLVATGSNSVFLPVFILFVATFGYIFVDRLEWIELGRIGSYIGMTSATTIAVGSYVINVFNESESGQLMAVAGLLVYPEAVLFLQRKNLRIYEQLAVFLLLEMIVAALVNDNLLFGILLAPIILLWVSSLFLFSRYASLVYVDSKIEKQTPKLAELIYKRFMKTVLGGTHQPPAVTCQLVVSEEVQSSRALRRAMQSIPIGIGALTFAGLFFYLLPRTSPGDLNTGFRNDRSVGLPSTLSFGAVGKLLQNRTPIMRVSLKNPLTNQPYAIESPPYLRSLVFDRYGANIRRQGWDSRGAWTASKTFGYRRLDGNSSGVDQLKEFGRDLVHVEFDIKKRFVSNMFCIPPVYLTDKKSPVDLKYDPVFMLFQSFDEISEVPKGRSLVYYLGSAGFANGQQLPVTPARLNLFSRDRQVEAAASSDELRTLLADFGFGFVEIRRHTNELLAQAGVDPKDAVRVAQAIENDFVFSGRFSYSLDLRPPSDPNVDPIEDFIVNQRSGHCQYFASAMVAMLRQRNIPCRIVAGYRPTEFNTLGNYFLVRQSDAHAWVEVLFARQQLVGTDYEPWLTNSEYYWIRFDPTPSWDGEETEIVKQQGQAMDYAEKLWKDYVVDGQKLSGANSIYAPVADSKDAYQDLLATLTQFRDSVQRTSLWDIRKLDFQWQVAILVVAFGVSALLLWQASILLPRMLSGLGKRIGVAKTQLDARQSFYARCVRLLERLGVSRKESETPREFTRDAKVLLLAKGQPVDGALDSLTNLYYRLRFSTQQSTTKEERELIDADLKRIEEAVAAARR